MKKYTIGQAAKITGMTAKNIRFYEEQGVIESAKREENGYRYFTEENLEEIRLLKYARDLGLPLAEIKRLMVSCENGDCEHSKEYIQKNIERYIGLLTERIKQMENLKSQMKNMLENGPYCCEILHQLAISKSKER